MGLSLDRIMPWGRTAAEYLRMFDLKPAALADGVLDCGGGPASFTAEMATRNNWRAEATDVAGGSGCESVDEPPARRISVVAVDPIYAFSGQEIRDRFEATAESIISHVRATPDQWCWSYHKDPDGLLANRRAALDRFLADFDRGLADGRYVAAQLPDLPFAADQFGLALSSHLLFLYSELLSEEFHIRSILEMGRIAREVRIFPMLDLRGEVSSHLAAVRSAVAKQGWRSEVVPVDYELQRGGNQMLRIQRV